MVLRFYYLNGVVYTRNRSRKEQVLLKTRSWSETNQNPKPKTWERRCLLLVSQPATKQGSHPRRSQLLFYGSSSKGVQPRRGLGCGGGAGAWGMGLGECGNAAVTSYC